MTKEAVVLTASASAFPELAATLGELTIQLEHRPLLSFEPPTDWGQLDSAVGRNRRLQYRAVALTSPRAAEALAERIDACGVAWDDSGPPVWVVGSTTQQALRGRVGQVRQPNTPPRPGEAAAACLARAMLDAEVESPVLFPCGDRRRDELPEMLRSHGIRVDEVVCYRSVLAGRQQARAAVDAGTIVIVASPSVATLLAETSPASSRPRLVAIGTATAEAARAAGWPPAAVAAQPSTLAVAAAVSGLLAVR